MKKLFITLLAFFGLTAAFAQTVPNAGFEEWTDNTHPVGWNGTFSANIPINYSGMSLTVIIDYRAANQSTDAHSGSAAVELVPQTASAVMGGIPVYSLDLPGVVQLGQFNTAAFQNIDVSNLSAMNFNIADYTYGGIACNQRPDSVTAWVKFVTTQDSLRAAVIATRWNNGQRQVVAQGEFVHQGAISEYTKITIPSAVKPGMAGIEPDTVNIIFSGGSQNVSTATRLYIDDVELYTSVVDPDEEDTTDNPGGDTTAIFQIADMPVFSVQPNPATDVLTVIPLANTEYSLRLFDMNGKLVRELNGLQNETRLSVSDLTKGVYFLQVKQGTNVRTQKVVVK